MKILDVDAQKLCEIFEKIGAQKRYSGNRYFVTYDYRDDSLKSHDILLRMTTTVLNAAIAKISAHVDNTSIYRKVIKFHTESKENIIELFQKIGLVAKTRAASQRISYEWN